MNSMYKAGSKERIGYLSQSVRDGVSSLEIVAACEGKACAFNGLNPVDNMKK